MSYHRSRCFLGILALAVTVLCSGVLPAGFHASSMAVAARGQTVEGFRVFLPLLTHHGADARPQPDTPTPTMVNVPMEPGHPPATPLESVETEAVEGTPAATSAAVTPVVTSTLTIELNSSVTITPSEIVLPTETPSPTETAPPTATEMATATAVPTDTALPPATILPTAPTSSTETAFPAETRVPEEQVTPDDAETQVPQSDQHSLSRTEDVATLSTASDADIVTMQFPSPTATFVGVSPYPGPVDVPQPTIRVPDSLPDVPAYPAPDDVIAPTIGLPGPLPTTPYDVATPDIGFPEFPTEAPFVDGPEDQVFPTPVSLDSTMPLSGQPGFTIGHLIAVALLLLMIGGWIQWQRSALWHYIPRRSGGRIPYGEADTDQPSRRNRDS